MTKRSKGQNPANRGGRPRDGRLGRATGLVDLLAFAAELNIEKINGIPKDQVSDELLALVASLSEQARTTGKLTLQDARVILTYQCRGDVTKVENFLKAEKRHRKRWAKENGPPFDTKPRPQVICTCEHRHCAGPCRQWAIPAVPCGRVIAEGASWTLPAPCRPAETTCTCRHVHCEGCGVGVLQHDPSIQPAYTCRIVLGELELQQRWIGWFCGDCMPAEFKPVALPEQPPRKLVSPGCPHCGGDVVIDGGRFRCVGLDAESHRLRVMSDLRESLSLPLRTEEGSAIAEQHAEFQRGIKERLRNLPDKLEPVNPCGREDDVAHLVAEQAWRLKSAASPK